MGYELTTFKGELGDASLPPLQWDGHGWTAEIMLPSWAGFQNRRGPYGSLSDPQPSDGRVPLTVGGEGAKQSVPPTPEMTAAFVYLIGHEAKVAKASLKAIFDAYPSIRETYGWDDGEAKTFMPDLAFPKDLKSFIGLHHVHILASHEDGQSCVGLEFGCEWDEHGVGVLTHRSRIIQVGGADVSFTEWIARRALEHLGD